MSMIRPRRKSPFFERINCVGGESRCKRGNVNNRSRFVLLSFGGPSTTDSSTALTLSCGTNVASDRDVLKVIPSSLIFVTSHGIVSPLRRCIVRLPLVACGTAPFGPPASAFKNASAKPAGCACICTCCG